MFDDIDWIESGQRVKTSGVGQKFRSSSVFGRWCCGCWRCVLVTWLICSVYVPMCYRIWPRVKPGTWEYVWRPGSGCVKVTVTEADL